MAASASGFFLLLLSVSVVQGDNGWSVTYTTTEICAIEGSTVEMSCSYKYPYSREGRRTSIKDTFWFTTMKDKEFVDLKSDSLYKHRVQYSCSESSCSLTITNVRKSDSGVYRFRFISNHPDGKFTGEPGVTLTITDDPNLHVNRYSTQSLECNSKCFLPDQRSYIWYKSGQEISRQTSSYLYDVDRAHSYSCAFRGHEAFPAPSVCVRGQTCNRVIYTNRSICAFKGSSVDISCTYNSYEQVTSKLWFRSDRSRQSPSQPEDLLTDAQFTGRVQVLEAETGGSTLRITELTERDSGQYGFTFRAGSFEWGSSLAGTTLTVTDIQVQRSNTENMLQCLTQCHMLKDSSYVWYKNGEEIVGATSSFYDVASYDYVNSYSCAVRGHEDLSSDSKCLHGKFCNRVIYTQRSVCAFKGSSVDISCKYNSYDYYYYPSSKHVIKTWFSHRKSNQWQSPSQPEDLRTDAQFTGRVQVLEAETGGSTLRITELTERDSGQYGFTFRAGSFEWGSSLAGTTLTVTDPDVQVQVIRSPSGLKLVCYSSCLPPGCSFVWYEDEKKVWSVTSPSYSRSLKDGASYCCAIQGHEVHRSASVYAPDVPSVSVVPSGEIVENSSVTLICSSDANPAANYTWYKRDSHPESIHEGPQLVFSSIQSSDSGQFYCRAENELGRRCSESIYVDVRYAPKMISVSVVPSGDIVEGTSVNLTCSNDANPAANYTWYKEDQTLPQTSGGIYFPSIKSWDRGSYSCKSENEYGHIKSASEVIDVQYAPDVPSVSVVPSGEIVEDSSVTLTCSSDANPAANYTWYKEDEESPKASGQNFTITDVRAEDGGDYSCVARNHRGSRRSVVHVTVVTSWMKSAAAGSLSAVIVLILFLFIFLWVRKKRFFKETPGRVEVRRTNPQLNAASEYDVPPAAAHRKPAEQQDDLFYASIIFSKSQDDALYSNVGAARLNRRSSDEEDVEYTMVNVQGVSPSPQLRCREAEEDSSALYSRLNKPHRA